MNYYSKDDKENSFKSLLSISKRLKLRLYNEFKNERPHQKYFNIILADGENFLKSNNVNKVNINKSYSVTNYYISKLNDDIIYIEFISDLNYNYNKLVIVEKMNGMIFRYTFDINGIIKENLGRLPNGLNLILK